MFEDHVGIRLLKVFLHDPTKEIHVREVAKVAKVSPGSAKKYLDILYGEKLLRRRKQANILLYSANLENPAFKQMKVALSVYKLIKCGLVDYLASELSPASITLFGSVARGEDDKNSDVDLFVLAKKKEIQLAKFEEKIGRTMNIIIYDSRTWKAKAEEDKPFYESVTFNGVVLYGELPVV